MEALTNRNGDIKTHEGYQYIYDKLGADKVTKYYRCRRRDIQCRGRINISVYARTADVVNSRRTTR